MVCLGLLAGCRNDAAPPAPLTRVKAVTAEIVDFTPSITLTGVIEARTRTDLSFRINGKISERIANVGDHVVHGPGAGQAGSGRAAGRGGVGQGERGLGRGAGAPDVGRLRPPEGAADPRQHHAARPRPGRSEPALGRGAAQAGAVRPQARRGPAFLHRAARRCRRHHHRAERRGRPGGGPGAADLHPGARRRARCRVQRPRMGAEQRHDRQGPRHRAGVGSGREDAGRHARDRPGVQSRKRDRAGQGGRFARRRTPCRSAPWSTVPRR